MSTSAGRHRKPRRTPKPPKPPKEKTSRDAATNTRKEIMFNMIELTLMILLGTVGVLMVLLARPITHRGPK
jgi:hypothetical protein